MKKARMNISHFRFILFNLKNFGEIVTTITLSWSCYICIAGRDLDEMNLIC